mmetsp:Transcript_5070/g.12100  ORF Transcript_5070/g.12100 Transcript_5070/m.12100 type:complete len:120 (-) Transcript_5070:755-1114(-)
MCMASFLQSVVRTKIIKDYSVKRKFSLSLSSDDILDFFGGFLWSWDRSYHTIDSHHDDKRKSEENRIKLFHTAVRLSSRKNNLFTFFSHDFHSVTEETLGQKQEKYVVNTLQKVEGSKV